MGVVVFMEEGTERVQIVEAEAEADGRATEEEEEEEVEGVGPVARGGEEMWTRWREGVSHGWFWRRRARE